ncbi:hypothetical protein G9A89_001114 [Geosiphon pyriformis]|nr:hypothetical protein G9A89_001114 [Geosiphon pyriformis]
MPNKNIIGRVVKKEDVIAHLGYYVAEPKRKGSNAAITIYFKGKTLTKADWISRKAKLVEFTYLGQKPNPSILVDEEWFQDVEKMWPFIISQISEIIKKRHNDFYVHEIYFIGHAIGGAYAILAAELWNIFRQKNVKARLYTLFPFRVITFGAPRVGNQNFARLVNTHYKTNIRVTYGNDHVPHFTVKKPFNNKTIMEHFETEIWIKPIGDNCDCEDNNETVEYYLCRGKKLRTSYEFYDNELPSKRTDYLSLPWFGGSGENPECNVGQSFFDTPHDAIHRGPYFRTIMGDCRGFGEFGFQGYETE